MNSKGQFENNPDLIGPRLKNRAFYSSRYYQERWLETHVPKIVTPEKRHEYNQRSYARRSKDPAYRERMRAYQRERAKLRPPRILTEEQRKRAHEYHKSWNEVRKSRPDYAARRKDASLKRKYGISLEQYKSMLLQQHNRCAICTKEFANGLKICVDHCHSTHKVRMLLCDSCNIGLGTFSDNPLWLRQAADYLERFNHEVVS